MSAVEWPRGGAWGLVRNWLSSRPLLTVEQLALVASLYFSLVFNVAYWRGVAATGSLHGAGGTLTGVSMFLAITALHALLLGVLLNRWTARPLLAVLLVATAAAAYFASAYTVFLDADMVRNVLHTDAKESRELFAPGMLAWVTVTGVLPAVAVWRVRVVRTPWPRAAGVRVLWMAGVTAVAIVALLVSFQNVSALMRNHKELRYLIAPGNYLVSLTQVVLEDHAGPAQPRAPIGLDAKVVGRPSGAKPRLLVLVVGETVRARNWGLNGYARQTTPQLAALAPLNFPDVTACGSATEVSLPCMFSPWGRADYDKDRIKHSQSLLHVLDHAGIGTLWRDNQTGCKGVCEGLPFESFEHGTVAGDCTAEGCMDDVLLDGLMDKVARMPRDAVVVLHQLGNHGPSYYARYPKAFLRFTPACETSELGDCSSQQVVNAYDNAILHTDDFLAKAIGRLAQRHDRDTALVYVSDHGESLGENGLFLHGVPYAIAPDTQIKVPMVMWLSSGMAASRGIDMACLRARSRQAASHDNLFHSVLGLLQVSTREYDPGRDLFKACTSPVS
ncbi:phosphoethanolamine transferase [Aerolutibacter ruishenii]|uniref:Lipid A ethanolaminephosphotransferase n=1 Tax=Aerolutibacter ruishenii TaxID=686800 RepID=A0A562LWS0_9GAMM|nr:phosphoethanolamine--lipid A transferase [Lysobacter ruishenii]TWI12080.1 lipid A ethanolaminephosphotransferase [Lysobacter ruishenii]